MEVTAEFAEFINQYKTKEDFIENLFLMSLIDSFSRVKKINGISDFTEPQIRNQYQYDLTYLNIYTKGWITKNFITFAAEKQIINKEDKIKRTDIEFIISGIIKFVVECKKLESSSKDKYLNNGISRFINNEYINENDKYAAMCSFVVADNIEKIIKGTKELISNYHLIDIKEQTICNYKYSFSSNHNKCNTTPILIYHLFFNFCEN